MDTPRVNLFCLPHAGGSALVYNQWKSSLHPGVRLIPVELAGRGERFGRPFYTDFQAALDDLYEQIKGKLAEAPFSFFGHSMGSILAYELIRRHQQLYNQEPLHAFFSGRYPPHISKEGQIYNLPDETLLETISSYGGTPREILENKKLSSILLPIIRADYQMIESYQYQRSERKLGCNISVFTGKSDDGVTYAEMREWADYTHGACKIHQFEGGHFFIHHSTKTITDVINQELTAMLIQYYT